MGRSIYTLAQSRTVKVNKPAKVVTGKGSDITNKGVSERKGKRKFITVSMTLSLVDIAAKKKNKEMEQKLWNSFHCLRQITYVNGIIYGKYCKNRACTICLGIRKAELINKYYSTILAWEEPYFVTLTVKACNAKKLPLMLDKMIQAFQLINDRQRKRFSRGNGMKLVGLRSLECNFNPLKRTYNPHFHIIVQNQEMAEILKSEWLKQWTPRYARNIAQDLKPIYNLKSSLVELIKYGTKIFTEPDLEQNIKGKHKIYIKALYNILEAMNGHRLFERFGFSPNQKVKDIVGSFIVTDHINMTYLPRHQDWIDKKTGFTLTNYSAPEELLRLLKDNIDTELE